MVHSLTTSFGLDFLMFEDKKGGDVDTVHKAREYQRDLQTKGQSDIHVSDNVKGKLTSDGKNKEAYDSGKYHQHEKYKEINETHAAQKQAGTLKDAYTGQTLSVADKTDLDHVVSAHSVHNDIGVLMAGDAENFANIEENLKSTQASINRSKKADDMDTFLQKRSIKIETKQKQLDSLKHQKESLNPNIPAERQKIEELDKKIENAETYIQQHKKVDEKLAKKQAEKAQKAINQKVNIKYYTSSKFFGSAAADMGKKGVMLGTRQAFGLMLAEVWFELKEQIPAIYRKCRDNFQLSEFLNDIGRTLKNIWERIKERFKDVLVSFKDGFLGGLFSSISTTIWNAFQTIGGNAIKIIRESWISLVQAVKLIFFNPQNLSAGQLFKEVIRIIGTAAAMVAGVAVNSLMHELLAFIPLDFIRSGLAAFVSALVSGVLTIGLTYVLDHGDIMKKVWAFLERFRSKYQRMLEHFQEINAELDRYLTELSKLEFNMNPNELAQFADALAAGNSELERSIVLNAEIKRRNIALPFEMGNIDSTRNWLGSLKS